MILEVGFIPILESRKSEFEDVLRSAVQNLLAEADGFIEFIGHGWGVERPNVYMFSVKWVTLEDHVVGFRESELFTEWRAQIGPFFDGAPFVEHFEA